MKIFSRSLALLTTLGLLSACGFHSVYGSHGGDDSPVAMDLNNIALDVVSDRKALDNANARNSQMLRNDLVDRMYGKNRPEQPAYHLTAKLRFDEQDLGILADSTTTRSLLNMYADYSLTDAHGEKVVSGTAHSVTSFDKLDQMYGTVAARQDAYERTVHEVSEQIVNRLSLYFSERP